jgi:acyl-CoA thioesterase 11/acyl-coenzyme A thioesterase 9
MTETPGQPAERPLKRIADSRLAMAEIVGEEGLQGQRMQAGAILDLMDVLAGRIAMQHSGSRVATLSFDRVDLTYPILHQDLVRLEGQLVSVGHSSMIIEVRGYRKDLAMREFMPVQRSFITMVAIDENRRANPNIPGLAYESPEEERTRDEAVRRKAAAARWVAEQEAIDQGPPLRAEEVEEPFNRDKREFLTPAETEIEVRRQFLPRNLNQLGTIFGGDVLKWMDRVATYTARHFTRNQTMVTLAMNRIYFKQPIFSTDLVHMKARVVYVRHYTLEVEITTAIQRMTGERVPSHSGYFTVLNYDEAGFKRPIVTGLRLSDADQEGLRAYQKAKARHRLWREEREVSSAG